MYNKKITKKSTTELQKNFAEKIINYFSDFYLNSTIVHNSEDHKDFIVSGIKYGWTSASWNTGGNWINCWGDEHEIDYEYPKDFYDDFNDFIKNYYPKLNIISDDFEARCIIEEDSEADYYGGVAYISRKKISVQDLQYLLIEKK